VTFAGRTREGESLLFVVGSDGRKLFAIDLLRKTLEEGERWEELGSAGRFARSLLLPPIDLAAAGAGTAAQNLFRFPTPETVGKELCYVVHFVDDDAAEHVYVSLSSDDGLPRRVDRIRGDAAGRPMTVTLDMWELEIDPALPADTFVPFDPSGGRSTRPRALGALLESRCLPVGATVGEPWAHVVKQEVRRFPRANRRSSSSVESERVHGPLDLLTRTGDRRRISG
jgi:hypothetical protein